MSFFVIASVGSQTHFSNVERAMCRGQVKRAVVFMGIIDILQPYSMKKQMETQMKAKPGDAKDFSYSAISAVPAQAYA